MVLVLATSRPLDLSQFSPQTIPNLGGARSINGSNAVRLAAKAKNLVIEAAGGDDGGWGSAVVLATVREKSQ
jgi:hypothetical protein